MTAYSRGRSLHRQALLLYSIPPLPPLPAPAPPLQLPPVRHTCVCLSTAVVPVFFFLLVSSCGASSCAFHLCFPSLSSTTSYCCINCQLLPCPDSRVASTKKRAFFFIAEWAAGAGGGGGSRRDRRCAQAHAWLSGAQRLIQQVYTYRITQNDRRPTLLLVDGSLMYVRHFLYTAAAVIFTYQVPGTI